MKSGLLYVLSTFITLLAASMVRFKLCSPSSTSVISIMLGLEVVRTQESLIRDPPATGAKKVFSARGIRYFGMTT